MLFKFISRLLACLLCSLSFFCSPAFALQQADFSWLPNGEPNLAGYKIYYSTVSAQYDTSVDVGNPEVINGVVQAPVNGLEDSTTYYFAATAYDSDGFESDYSQEVVWASPGGEPVTPPSPPVALVTQPSPPVAKDLSLSISEDITGTGQLNGQSSNSLPLSYQIVTNGSKGTALITDSGAGSFSYTPQANINGVDTFSYKVSDANGESGVAMVSITIVQVNDAPTAGEQLDFTNEDQVLKGYLTAHDVEGDSLTYTIGNNASNGLVVISADGSYSYTPDPDLNGSDFFTFQANDGSVYSNSAIVNISINPVNDVPVASDDTLSVQENQTTTGILQGNDIDSGQLIYSLVSNGILGTATIVDAATGTYTYTSAEGVFGEDSFQFIVSDGSDKSNQATVHVSIQQAAPSFALEIGELTVSGTWSYISFTETFQDPVVVAKPASSNDPSPCVVRIRNVSSKGFDIRLQNYDYITEEHGLENLGYMAVERGNFVLENGKRVEAGFFNTNATDYPEKVSFSEQFSVMPVVATSIVTEKEYDAVVSRVENISENGFDYQMQEQEANSVLHTFEEVAYIAWEPFSGMIGNFAFEIHMHQDEVNDQWQSFSFQQGFDKPPVLIAGMQSQYWRDTANLRHTELKANGVQIKVTEEQSIDSETDHAFEAFSFMAIADIDLEGDADNDGLITAEERDFYGTSPGVADTDEDGLDDGAETIFWGAAWESDADNDGIVNLLDPDSDNDGFLDGEEVELGFDPADSSSNPDAAVEPTEDPITTVITLEVNATKIRGKRTAELFWSGASGDSVQITRIRENNEVFTISVPNENYYKEILGKSGTYTYQVCETDRSLCSDVITVGL